MPAPRRLLAAAVTAATQGVTQITEREMALFVTYCQTDI